MSKLRIQQYMEKHKLTPLFEELMNKVLHDQPTDPLVYLIKCLYKKAALPVPKELKPGTLRRSSPERIVRRSQSPDKSATQAWAVGSGPDLVDRSYEKPWLSGKKKTREDRAESPPKQGTRQASTCIYTRQPTGPSKSPVRKGPAPLLPLLGTPNDDIVMITKSGAVTLNVQPSQREETLEDILYVTPKPLNKRRKQKSGWVSDTKVTTTTFDELFEADHGYQETAEKQASTQHRKDHSTDITKAWSRNVGLDDGEDANYRSRGYTGPRCHRNDEDPLAGELMLATESNVEETTPSSVVKTRSAKLEAQKHREDLEKLLSDTDKASVDSGFEGQADQEDDIEDDAIELLEDPEELRREGVTKVSKSGYKLSRILRQRQEETNVKLNINLYTGRVPSYTDNGSHYGDYYESDLERPQTGMSYQSNRYSDISPDNSDEEFESVSQVAGPRKPVWTVPDSDGESHRQDYSKTLPEPGRRKKVEKLNSTVPVRFADKPPQPLRSVDSEKDLFERTHAWSPAQKELSESPPDVQESVRESVRESVKSSRSYAGAGWEIPDDTEVSLATDWTAGGTSARPGDGPPKAY